MHNANWQVCLWPVYEVNVLGELQRRLTLEFSDERPQHKELVSTILPSFLVVVEEMRREFPGCCKPNHYIPLSEEMKKWAKEHPPDVCPCHKWSKKWLGK